MVLNSRTLLYLHYNMNNVVAISKVLTLKQFNGLIQDVNDNIDFAYCTCTSGPAWFIFASVRWAKSNMGHAFYHNLYTSFNS